MTPEEIIEQARNCPPNRTLLEVAIPAVCDLCEQLLKEQKKYINLQERQVATSVDDGVARTEPDDSSSSLAADVEGAAPSSCTLLKV